jgi:thioredoxin reductase
MVNKVAITGAGPAGIACAIQLSRYGIMPLLFDKDSPGGLLKNASLVENYPGFPGGIPGISLARKMTKQLELARVPLINEEVINIDYQNDIFQIQTHKNQYTSRILVITSGTSPIRHTITGIQNPESHSESPIKKRIFYEVYPIRDIHDARIAIIGAGDAAFDYALQMSAYNKVYVFNRSEQIKCLPLLWHRAKSLEQISYFENHSLIYTEFDPALTCLKLLFQTHGEMKPYLADYIIFAIGRRPELSFADAGLFSLFEQLQQEKKLYFAGDVKNDLLRQASIAAGDGIKTAMEIYFNESH